MISPATLLTQEHPLQDHLRNQHSDNDPSSAQLRALNCNLTSLYDHIQMEGFHSGAFSDIIIEVMGSTYRLHRLILSRSSYFRNMLYGPWKEAVAPKFVLKTDDPYVNSEAVTMALKYLYGYYPKLNDDNAFRVLAAASFLDLQDLCVICTDFIIFELRTSNFLTYQVFAESQEYGIHGERVRNACWRYLCQCGTIELKEVLPKLSSQTLHALLTSDEFWVPNEEKRFELALFTLLAKGTPSEEDGSKQEILDSELEIKPTAAFLLKDNNLTYKTGAVTSVVSFSTEGITCLSHHPCWIVDSVATHHISSQKPPAYLQMPHPARITVANGDTLPVFGSADLQLTPTLSLSSVLHHHLVFCSLVFCSISSPARCPGHAICAVFFLLPPVPPREALHHPGWRAAMHDEMQALWANQTWDLVPLPAGHTPVSCKWVFVIKHAADDTIDRLKARLVARGMPSSTAIYMRQFLCSSLPGIQQIKAQLNSAFQTKDLGNLRDLGRFNMPSLWGGRTVGRRKVKSAKVNCGLSSEEYDAFHNVFEGGSLLYCNMSFEALLNVRKQLEELGFPCRSVNDGLWLQTLLCQKVQEIATDMSSSCRHTSNFCTCRQPYEYGHGCNTLGYYRQDHDRSSSSGSIGNIHIAESQSEGHGIAGPVRVHVRGPIDGLAGIGRGPTYPPGSAWPPTRYVFSRVPFGLGNRNGQQTLVNDGSEARVDLVGEQSGDGLTALVNHSQGSNPVHVHTEQTEGIYEANLQGRFAGSTSHTSSIGFPVQMLGSEEQALGIDCESSDGSIVLDRKTPLRDIPPFRFGAEFEEVHRLIDGQVKHSPEVFYAGSFWKLSAQAFNDEDPHGRRTLGLFIHRRKAEVADSLRKVHMYVDSREKVTARYQLICPSKKEVMVFGSFKQEGTLLPKAPKGWGWRTALFFDELDDLLQRGALRVAAIVQLV
ncbi:hypothetical protein KSP40_PGU011647 [Platanthera guangdongensis]|uniref:BTB domain-containing protein n=1 Tax=Platanthera guangdongensis TaxID=2320717 RepID=A0ABR2M8L8_9ASPA